MPLRPIRLPGDLLPLTDMLAKTFQYPDHPEWGIREDEQQDIIRMIKSLRRLWPIIRVLQLFSPALRDLFRGFAWEEHGQIVGVVLCQRENATASWGVGIVGVLPEYRGRGIARQMLTRALDDLRERGAEQAALGVIDRNVPAYSLYTSLGFEHYSGTVELEITPSEPPTVPPLPDGYVYEPAKRSKLWRFRYELDQRVRPPELVKYEPVVIERYRPPAAAKLLGPVLRLLQRREVKPRVFRREVDRRLVAWGTYDVPMHPGGVDSMRICLDREHSQLADYLVAYHLERAATRGPGRRVGFIVASWMPEVIHAAERLGFTRRVEYHHLGLML